jgi:hypothetical protein
MARTEHVDRCSDEVQPDEHEQEYRKLSCKCFSWQVTSLLLSMMQNVSYGSGSFSGTEYTDQVSLGKGLVIQNQSIGVASTATGFNDVDGIVGSVSRG